MSMALLLTFQHVACAADTSTPTYRYLTEYPAGEVSNRLIQELSSGSEEKNERLINTTIPFLFDVAAQEDEYFVAYHGTTQRVSLIQDITKAIVEKVLDYQLPHDFTFLRIPGDSFFSYGPDVKGSFLRIRDAEMTDELRIELADHYIFSPLSNICNTTLTSHNFSFQELSQVDSLFKHYSHCSLFPNDIDVLKESEIISRLAAMIAEYDSSLSLSFLVLEMTKLLSYDSITASGITDKEKDRLFDDFLESFAPWEFNPYTYRDEDDVRMRELRAAFNRYLYFYWDSNPLGIRRVVSCVVPLFAGEPGENCIGSFVGNESYEMGATGALYDLRIFAKSLGIKPEVVDGLLAKTMNVIKESNVTEGVLCQFFDYSAPRFAIANNCSYISIASGHPIKDSESIPSEHLIDGELPFSIDEHDLQLRLIPDNASLLNPWNNFRTVKHTLLPEKTQNRIDRLIQETIDSVSVDEKAKELLSAKLESFWG